MGPVRTQTLGSASSGSVVGVVIDVVRQHEVPSVEAVLAAVGDDVAGQPITVLARVRQQMTPASAIDADDRPFRFQRDPQDAIR
jgi:hypothetical protein